MYGQVLAFYLGLLFLQTAVSVPFRGLFIVGSVINSFALVYAYVAIGCMLGLTVDKKAEELGLE